MTNKQAEEMLTLLREIRDLLKPPKLNFTVTTTPQPTTTAPIPNGWTCAYCGSFVGNGVTHSCPRMWTTS